jgi:hypothetical protein
MEQIRRLKDQPFAPELILELHRIATDGTLNPTDAAGRFRRADERISVMDPPAASFSTPRQKPTACPSGWRGCAHLPISRPATSRLCTRWCAPF